MNNTPKCYKYDSPDFFGLIFSGIAPLFLLFFGIIGMLFSTRRLRSNKSKLVQYLLFLYVWDSFLLVSTFGFYGIGSLATRPIGNKPTDGVYTVLYMIFYPLVNFSMTASMWTMVVISIERYVALRQPLRHHSRDVNRLSLLVRGTVVLGSILINIPKLFELTTKQCWEGDMWKPQIARSGVRLNAQYQLFYGIICNIIFISPLPFLVTLVLTVKTWLIRRSVLRAQIRRQTSMKRSDRMAYLLLAMLAKFLFCQSCPTMLNVIELTMGQASRWFGYLADISNLLVILNSATNWLVFSYLPSPRTRKQTMTSIKSKKSVGVNAQQYKVLEHIWPKDKHKQLGIELLRAAIKANPSFREKLAEIYCVDVFDESSHWEHVSHHGENIGSLLDKMFSLALNCESFAGASTQIGQAARAHASHGIVLRNADWLVVKRYLLEGLFEQLDEDHKQLANQLVSLVVSELKHGFTYGSPSPKLAPRGATWSISQSMDITPPTVRKNRSVCMMVMKEEQEPLLISVHSRKRTSTMSTTVPELGVLEL